MKLTILHTNDLHSHFENIAKIATIFKQHTTANTLRLDAGDFADPRDSLIHAEEGKFASLLLSSLNYDAAAIGNNEGFMDATTIFEVSKIPYVCCNLRFKDGAPLPNVVPSIIETIDNIRFLIIGNTVNGEASYNDFFSLCNKHSSPYLEAIGEELERNKGNYDIAILLSHASYHEDIEAANRYPELQIIIGGHTHKLMNTVEKHNNAYLHISGQWGEHVGKLELEIDETSHNIVSCLSSQLPTSEVEDDLDTVKYLKSLRKISREKLSIPLYTINHTIWHDLLLENPMSNLLADALYDSKECDLGIINSGVILGGLEKGDVSEYHLLSIAPSPLNPTYTLIKGSAIKEALELSLDEEYCLRCGSAAGYRSYYIGQLAFSYNVRIEDGIIYINNSPLVDGKEYRVMTSDYLQRGSGYPPLYSEKEVQYDNGTLRDLIKEYAKEEKHLIRAIQNRFIKR